MRTSNKKADSDAVGFTIFEVSIGLLLGFVVGCVVFAGGFFFHLWP